VNLCDFLNFTVPLAKSRPFNSTSHFMLDERNVTLDDIIHEESNLVFHLLLLHAMW
jgi:hypothetical protein